MKYAALIIVCAVLATACSDTDAPLVATDISIARPLPGTRMTAGYLTLTNNTSEQITITEVTSPEFHAVQMHESVIADGIVRMRALDQVTIPPGDSVDFEPGARHLMLIQPTGETNNITLEFIAGEAVVLTINAALTD
jgi:periplasmic copper chaperone A